MDKSKPNRGSAPAPTERNETAPKQQQQEQPGEGTYRNVETGVNSRESFDDDYEVQKEDELTMEEPKTEDDNRTGKS